MLKIRKIRNNDYDALIKLWQKAKLSYRPKGRDSKKNIAKQLKQHNTIYLVAELDNKIIGSILGTHDSRRGYLNRLAVLPEYQKKGIARQLVKAVEKYLGKKGIQIVTCLIEDWNKTSLKVFEKLGYQRHNDIIYFSKRKSPQV